MKLGLDRKQIEAGKRRNEHFLNEMFDKFLVYCLFRQSEIIVIMYHNHQSSLLKNIHHKYCFSYIYIVHICTQQNKLIITSF